MIAAPLPIVLAWGETCVGLGLTRADGVLEDLRQRYGEGHRRYHDLTHIEACLRVFEPHRRSAERPAEVMAAIFFHDAVYEPLRSDNEARSAELARDVLGRAGAQPEAIERIAAMILASATHPQGATGDTALFLDVDLSILGEDAATFDAYDRAIREEYAAVPDDLYYAKRSEVLRGFLERRRIYLTDALHGRGVAARDNLERSLDAATRRDPNRVAQDGVTLAGHLVARLAGVTVALVIRNGFRGLAGEEGVMVLRVEPGPPELVARGVVARDEMPRLLAALAEAAPPVFRGGLIGGESNWEYAWSIAPAPPVVLDRLGVIASAAASETVRIGTRHLDRRAIVRVEVAISVDLVDRELALVLRGGERVVVADQHYALAGFDPTYSQHDLDRDGGWAPLLALALGRALGVDVWIDPK